MTNSWREELAWVAGFFDGEGTYIIGRQSGVRMSADQVDRRALDRCQEALLGLGNVLGPYQPKVSTRRPIFRWQITDAQGVQAATVMLWPFLGPVKREQALNALQKLRWRIGPYKTHCLRGHEFTPQNTRERLDKNGYLTRRCRTCGRLHTQRYKEKLSQRG